MSLRLFTDRLELVPFSAPAIDALLEGDEPRLRAATGFGFPEPLRPPPLTEELLPMVRDRLRVDPATAEWWIWMVADRRSREVVGSIGFGGPPGPDGTVMIGYATYPGAERLGLATEATRALVSWALARPGVARVCASIPPDNTAARRVAEKVGMRVAGRVWEEETDEVLLYTVER